MTLVNQRGVSYTAGQNILASNIKPSNPGSWLTITIIPATTGKLSVVHNDGTNNDVGILNNNENIVAGTEVSVSTPVPTSEDGLVQETINIRFSAGSSLTKLIISEGA